MKVTLEELELLTLLLEELELLTLFRKLSESDQAVMLRVAEANASLAQAKATAIYEEAKAVGLNVRPHKNESIKEIPHGQQ